MCVVQDLLIKWLTQPQTEMEDTLKECYDLVSVLTKTMLIDSDSDCEEFETNCTLKFM